MNKALIAMSGGVDSSLAAKLTLDMEFDCIGCTMKLYDNDDINAPHGKTCCSLDDVEDARAVANRLGIPFYVFNFKEEFKDKVINNFINSYEEGRTPNPCIECNKHLKFDKLFDRAHELGYDYVVTGHYARVESDGNRFYLKKAVDENKDQSYVLYSLTQEQLSHVMFPLGNFSKTTVREMASENNFVNAAKPDSQDICFIPDGDYAAFMERNTGKIYEPGNFIDVNGNVLGQHKGIIRYTVGQRKGLGIALGTPMYVKRVNIKDNTVTLASDAELFSKEVLVDNVNWTSGVCPTTEFNCKAKIRYRHKEQPCQVFPITSTSIKIVFDEPQRAPTPGQSAVLYDGDIVLGGGIIC